MSMLRIIFFMMAFLLVFSACAPVADPPTATPSPRPMDLATITPTATELPAFEFSPIPLKSGIGFRASWMELYFTDPTSLFATENSGGVDGPLSAGIVAARESVDVALNSLGVNSIVQALIRAHSRGVRVRVVMETNNMVDRLNPQQLMDAGIPIVDDRRDGVMNNTFLVIDNAEVWTGSVNYTSSGMFRQNNNLIRVFSNEIAANYTKEFEEMFMHDQFGSSVVPDTPNPQVIVQDTQIEVLFSPDDLVVSRLVQLVGEAQESINFLAYSFNSTALGDAIRKRAAQGVSVAGVMESTQLTLDGTTEYDLFRQAGLDVRPGNSAELMNHKVIIIDGRIVVAGSYDFTNRAENVNDENVMIIHSEKVAEKFMEEFQRMQARAQP